ncbi:MAG: hypothetical protein SGPRY_000331 [Prymnesium sp.]
MARGADRCNDPPRVRLCGEKRDELLALSEASGAPETTRDGDRVVGGVEAGVEQAVGEDGEAAGHDHFARASDGGHCNVRPSAGERVGDAGSLNLLRAGGNGEEDLQGRGGEEGRAYTCACGGGGEEGEGGWLAGGREREEPREQRQHGVPFVFNRYSCFITVTKTFFKRFKQLHYLFHERFVNVS